MRPTERPLSPAWTARISPITSAGALGVLGFAYCAVAFSLCGVTGKAFDLTMFALVGLALPPACAAVQAFLIRPKFGDSIVGFAESVNTWATVALLVGLFVLPLLMGFGVVAREHWLTGAQRVVLAVGALHVGALTGSLVVQHRKVRFGALRQVLASRSAQTAAISLALLCAVVLLFWIDPAHRYLNFVFQLYFDPPFSKEGNAPSLWRAFLLAVIGTGAVASLMVLESAHAWRDRWALRLTRRIALGATIAAVALFFDYALTYDVTHYTTNVAPALHVRGGGTLLVDAFSQYGPGPVIATLLAFRLGPVSFGTAQISVQVANLAYYALWLICLYRMTRWKLAGLLLGFFSIAVLLGTWAYGQGNLNETPSVLAYRQLPVLCVVLALSFLRPPRRHSVFTALAVFVSALWSPETLIGALFVHGAFLTLLGWRDRAWTRTALDLVAAVVPAGAALLVLTLAALTRAGEFPDLATHAQYLLVYAPTTTLWGIIGERLFLGWMAVGLVLFVIMTEAWARAFVPTARNIAIDDAALFHQFLPMAALLAFQASYFVGRSVDYTLLMALLPFCAIAIPAGLAFANCTARARGAAKLLTLIPTVICLWVLTFTALSLLRPGSPYALYLHECRDHGRCAPAALIDRMSGALRVRPILERTGRAEIDVAYDTKGIIRDAMTAMERWAPNDASVTVLLGQLHRYLWATEFALMYAGKWNRWPRSWTFSDHLIERSVARIVAAPVRLRAGELVLVRQDERALGAIEIGILNRIRKEARLCRLPLASTEVVAYRVAGPGGCEGPDTDPR